MANSVGDPNILKGFSVDGRVETSLGSFVSAYEGALDVAIRPECIEVSLNSTGPYTVKECIFYGHDQVISCLLYTSPSPRDGLLSRMPSSA